MGHSFHLGQEPFPKTTQPLYLTIPETRRLHVPRSPISDPTEDTALIKSYLESKPQQLRYRKRLSAISRTVTQSTKRSLGIFHLSSTRFSYLLRPRSLPPPAPAPSTHATEQESRSCGPLSKTPQKTDINRTKVDSSLSAVGFRAGKLKLSMTLNRDVDNEEEMSEKLDMAGPKRGSSDSLRPQLQGMESGTYDIIQGIPYLTSNTAGRFSQQDERTWTNGSQSLLLSNARQAAEHDEHGLSSHKPTLIPRGPLFGSVRCRDNDKASVTFNVAHNTDGNVHARRSSDELDVAQKNVANTALPTMNDKGQSQELHKLSSSFIMHIDSRELPRRSKARSSLEVRGPRDLSSSIPLCAKVDSSSSHISPYTESFRPSPAPDLPLPPLPERESSPYSLLRNSRDQNQEHNRSPQNSDPLRAILPSKSPARYKKLNSASQQMQPGDLDRDGVSQIRKDHRSMYRNSSFEGTSEASTPPPKLAQQATRIEDPFTWRKLRNQRTQELKKRHLEQSRVQQEKSYQGDDSHSVMSHIGEETDDTIVLPSVDISNRAHDASVDSDTNVEHYNKGNSSVSAAHSKSHLPESLASPNPVRQAPTQKASITEQSSQAQSHYRDHSTQCAIPRSSPSEARAPTVLPPGNQSATENPDHPKSMPCVSCEQRRRSGRNSHSPFHGTSEGLETLPTYLGDLEDRLEARLGAFERRTILLEAALLAVINASANFDPISSCHTVNRLSGMSGRSDASAPIGSKPEAIISGMDGIGR